MHIMRMTNPRKNYAWGSRVALQRLLGEQPDGTPLAEIWMGAHPSAPSRLENGTTLAELPDSERQYITFILKLLSAEKGLSIQAHPSKEQAERGFAAESGMAVDAPNRVFRDRNHKPELIVALEPFWAMSGFRPLYEARNALVGVGIPEAAEVSTLQGLLDAVLALDSDRTDEILRAPFFREAPAPRDRLTGHVGDEDRVAWVAELYRQFGGDSGVLAPMFLNLVYLSPGTGLYQPSGVLHAYLRGTGVEVMAESDNVLRAGLTEKHVDVNGLRNVVSFVDDPPAVREPVAANPANEPLQADDGGRHALEVYETPAEEFRLYRLRVEAGSVRVHSAGLPAIAVCVGGSVSVREGE
ncbi:MAG: mannose-6-phosphate isomerase, class I, partial [bacterium]